MADLYKGHDASDQGQHGCPYHFTAVFAYADLMWPLIANTDLNMMTLSAGLSTLRGQFITNYPVLMAGSVLAMVPMVILYLVFQKQFIEGIAMTGGK